MEKEKREIVMLRRKAYAEYLVWLANEEKSCSFQERVCKEKIYRAIMRGEWNKYAEYILSQEQLPISFLSEVLVGAGDFIYSEIVDFIDFRLDELVKGDLDED